MSMHVASPSRWANAEREILGHGGGAGHPFRRLLSGVVDAFRRRRRFRRLRAELSRLSDDELNDIGLERSDIEAVARRGAGALPRRRPSRPRRPRPAVPAAA